ncbi:MAG TPA: EAL domain-containing protein [Candidatus Elarobacter sp.]|nr:EAL domain-containing protein [Candidatus Elarobacter sp.]
MRQYRLPVIRSDREAHPTRDLARAWTRAIDHVAEPELRLRAALSLARTLVGAERAIVFDGDRIIAGVPAPDGVAVRRLFERARRVLEDELVTPELYVARLAPERAERVAMRWREPRPDTVEIARAIVASCTWALEQRIGERAPANLPDGGATLRRLEQLVHDARRMRRSFAVVYVDVEPPRSAPPNEALRDAVARQLRREVRANDHLGHLGGDAYLALLALESGESEAYPAAQRLLRAAAAAASDACAHVGVAICPEDGVQPEDLVEKAGAAAMAAASVGGARPHWYRESAGRELGERAAIRARLRDGDPGALLELAFQPILDAATGAPCGASAAAVWIDPGMAAAQPPAAYLGADPDRSAREAFERWTIAAAARAYRAWRAAGLDLHVHLTLANPGDAIVDAIAAGFGSDDAMRAVLAEIVVDETRPELLESFARRLHALGARVGVAAWRTSSPPFDGTNGLLDFVTVEATQDVRTLAELALASVVAPMVLASGASDRERARWLARHGATALRGQGLAAPMRLQQLVRWASDRRDDRGL